MFALQETDIMAEAAKKQDEKNNEGLSMAELLKRKRNETEKALADKQPAASNAESVEDRKARLQAQRDALRKQKESKR